MKTLILKENQQFNLINGQFEPKEALPLISLLYNAKIEHHNRKSLRLKEKNDVSYKKEDERVQQLENECKAFKDLMKNAIELGLEVILKGDIHVQIISKLQ